MTRRSVPISLVMFNPAIVLKMYRIWRRIGYDTSALVKRYVRES